MVTGSPSSLDQLNSAAPLFEWSYSLLRSDPEKLPLVLAVICIAYSVSFWGVHNPLLALVPTLLVVSSVSEFLFPIHYSVSQRGVSARWAWNTLEMTWDDVRRIYDLETGLKFSPLSRKNSLFEAVRGIRVRFDTTERRVEILGAVALWRKDNVKDA